MKVTVNEKTKHENRESYLMAAVELLKPVFQKAGAELPKVRVSTGWPSIRGTSLKLTRIGECWDKSAADDSVAQIFISPLLDDVAGVLSTLSHEIVHAVVGTNAKHGPVFKKLATGIGLAGKMTATHPGESLTVHLKDIAERLGQYPHAKLNPKLSGVKKQTTRMIKCVCAETPKDEEQEPYVARTSRKWITEVGAPLCPCHKLPMKYELPDAEDEDGDGGED